VGSEHGGKDARGYGQPLCIPVTDVPDTYWTARDVDQAQRNRPVWLQWAQKALGAVRAEHERRRKADTRQRPR
jgi:hypothetical protein